MARSRRDSLVVIHAGDDLGGSCCCWARLAGNREDVSVVLHAGDDPKGDGGHECSDLAITATTHQLEKAGPVGKKVFADCWTVTHVEHDADCRGGACRKEGLCGLLDCHSRRA